MLIVCGSQDTECTYYFKALKIKVNSMHQPFESKKDAYF